MVVNAGETISYTYTFVENTGNVTSDQPWSMTDTFTPPVATLSELGFDDAACDAIRWRGTLLPGGRLSARLTYTLVTQADMDMTVRWTTWRLRIPTRPIRPSDRCDRSTVVMPQTPSLVDPEEW